MPDHPNPNPDPVVRPQLRRWALVAAIVLLSTAAIFIGLMLRLERVPQAEPPIGTAGLPSGLLRAGSHQLIVELAMTDAAQQQGLSDRRLLADNHGMLFIFDEPELQTFWMNRMRFPLDMLFLRDGTVVEIREQIPPPGETNGIPRIVASTVKADQVLELNAGQAAALGIRVGDPVELDRE